MLFSHKKEIDDNFWCLYDLSDSKFYSDLSLREVQIAASVLSEHQRKYWFAWKTGLSEWKNIEELPQLMIGIPEIENPTLSPPNPSSIQHNVNRNNLKRIDVIASEISVDTINGNIPHHHRLFKRFSIRVPVEVISNGKSFKTFSLDMSVGGINLEGPIPDYIGGYSTIIISPPDQHSIEFLCHLVEDQEVRKKSRLVFFHSESFNILNNWLESLFDQK